MSEKNFKIRISVTLAKPYGVGALDRVRESFAGFWEEELKLVSDQTRIENAREVDRHG